jgi:excisionase family DNA binding protein
MYLTVNEVSNILRIKPATFRSWINRDKAPFPVIKLRRKILIDENDLKNFLARAKTEEE